MNDITATLGLVQLKKLNKANKKRRELALRYRENLKNIKWLKFLKNQDWALSAQHNFVIKTKYRDKLNLYLKERKISSGVHYVPIHHFSYYKKNKIKADVPRTETVWKQILTLPLYPTLSIRDQNRVITAIKEFNPKRHKYHEK